MLKKSTIGKLFGFGKEKKKSDESPVNERGKRDDDIHIEISQLSDND